MHFIVEGQRAGAVLTGHHDSSMLHDSLENQLRCGALELPGGLSVTGRESLAAGQMGARAGVLSHSGRNHRSM
jgi:hypothetical protein